MKLKPAVFFEKRIYQIVGCFLGMTFLSLPLCASETTIQSPALQDLNKAEENELPHGYVRQLNIAQQIDRYRTLIHPVWQNLTNKDDLPRSHIPGLIEVVREAVAIVNDILEKGPPGEKKIQAKADLQNIWGMAQQVDNYQLLSLENSATLHLMLASVLDQFRGYLQGTAGAEERDIFNNTIEAWSKAIDRIKADNSQGDTDSFNDFKSAFSKRNSNSLSAPGGSDGNIFILHRHPDPMKASTNIGMKTFVDQYFDHDYPACLALFDVVSSPSFISHPEKMGTSKRDPHWGIENGAKRMLVHDCDHCRNIFYIQRYDDYRMKIGGFKLGDDLQPVYDAIQYYASKKNSNAVTVLTNGLFIMFHEVIPSGVYMNFKPRSESRKTYDLMMRHIKGGEKEKALLNMVELVRKHMILSVKGKTDNSDRVGSYRYKSEVRDWEHILKKGLDLDNQPFLSTLPISKTKRRPFPAGHRQGESEPYLVEKEESNITYLPTVPEALKAKRYELMTAALKDGYNRFWKTFSYYLEEFMKEREGK